MADKLEPSDEAKDAVSAILARLGIAFATHNGDEADQVFDEIDELYKADPDAILELYKATTVLAATLALKSFTQEGNF